MQYDYHPNQEHLIGFTAMGYPGVAFKPDTFTWDALAGPQISEEILIAVNAALDQADNLPRDFQSVTTQALVNRIDHLNEKDKEKGE